MRSYASDTFYRILFLGVCGFCSLGCLVAWYQLSQCGKATLETPRNWANSIFSCCLFHPAPSFGWIRNTIEFSSWLYHIPDAWVFQVIQRLYQYWKMSFSFVTEVADHLDSYSSLPATRCPLETAWKAQILSLGLTNYRTIVDLAKGCHESFFVVEGWWIIRKMASNTNRWILRDVETPFLSVNTTITPRYMSDAKWIHKARPSKWRYQDPLCRLFVSLR